MLISVAVLAHNEANNINQTITSLFDQKVFNCPSGGSIYLWEVIIVPNGCTDDTAQQSLLAFERLAASRDLKNVTFSVKNISQAGKSNAWNRYVHEFSSGDAEVIILIDADIEFGHPDTISNCLDALLTDSNAVVCVDTPLKDVSKKRKKTLFDKISLLASKGSLSGPVAISGQFYCARAANLREVYMPVGLAVEDGFLHAMIVTKCFRCDVDETKVIRAKNASHFYEALLSIRAIFHHEVRLKIGSVQNCYLTWDLLSFATDPNGPGAGIMIRNRLAFDSGWYSKILDNAVRNHGWWVLPHGMLFSRFSKVKKSDGLGSKLKSTIIALMIFPLDLAVCLTANHKLKNGTTVGFW